MASRASLIADIVTWIRGDDIEAQIPSFIALAEDRHKWGAADRAGKKGTHHESIRVREMEKRVTLTGVNSFYLPLPADYLEHRRLTLLRGSLNDLPLKFIGADMIASTVRDNRANNWPTGYTIVGTDIEFNDTLSDQSSVSLAYYAPFSPLVADTDTNWLLDNAYGAYLWGALAEAEPFLQDDGRTVLWEQKYAMVLSGLTNSDIRSRTSRSNYVTRSSRFMP